jgi:O-6-methylguanine DNA methyltransferase
MHLRVERQPSPLGTLLCVTSADGVLRALDYESHEARMLRLLGLHYRDFSLEQTGPTRTLGAALAAYFAGEVSALDTLAVATAGTDFQRSVWRALRKIPCGGTVSYGQLAAQLGRPGAARAVGLANGANPITIVVPCHRVIGADGSLTGYAHGLERKRWLLAHEQSSRGPASKSARVSPPGARAAAEFQSSETVQ